MHCLTALLSVLIAHAAAAPARVVVRDLAETISIMTPVLDGLGNYDAIVQCFTGGDAASFKAAGNVLLTTVNATIIKAGNMPNLTLEEAQGFQPLSDKLNAAGDAVIAHLGDKLQTFELFQMCEYIQPFVDTLSGQVDTMMKTVATKFPAAGQSKDATTIQHFEENFGNLKTILAGCQDVTRGSAFVGFSNGTFKAWDSDVPASCSTVVKPSTTSSGSGATSSGGVVYVGKNGTIPIVTVNGATSASVNNLGALLVAAAFAAYVF